MASLADAQPPIALGALDGRYRAAVAPLVDHLSEAALNRERVRVEVEWLIHQTSRRDPGRTQAERLEVAALRGIVESFGRCRWPSSPRSSASPSMTSRRSSTS